MTGRWRVGAHWAVEGGMTTVIREGPGPADADGRRDGDVLVGVAKDPDTATLIVAAVNAWHEQEQP